LEQPVTHPSFGPVPPNEFAEAQRAPFGQATKILRKYDPLFGRVGPGPTKTFRISVRKRVYRTDSASVEVEATDEAQARDLIDEMDWNKFSWDEGCDEDDDDCDIHSVREVK
jgi:hypothetical protein